jgi:hypothetical protein
MAAGAGGAAEGAPENTTFPGRAWYGAAAPALAREMLFYAPMRVPVLRRCRLCVVLAHVVATAALASPAAAVEIAGAKDAPRARVISGSDA